MTTDTRTPDYWRGQADAFTAITRMESTVFAGLRAWAEAEARLAKRAAWQARLVQLAAAWRRAS